MKPEKLFPMFLKLSSRQCLVVGAGTIGETKIAGLLETGAKIRVVAPKATAQVRFWAQAKAIEWHQRAFQPSDLEGMFLVVAATSSTELHERIFALASQCGVLCNIVDVPAFCDFYYPSVVQRGALQIAISTTGLSPALAQRLRKELEDQFGPEYADWLVQLGEARDRLHATDMDPEERRRQLHELASEAAFQTFLRSRRTKSSR
jgi:precorrin-2 dehydrogenase/sirohydrochlorin ferrochelatase